MPAPAAIQSLVEQGVTTLAKINDNYRVARRGGNALLDLIKEDLTSQAEILVDNGTAKRKVVVNIPRRDPVTGQEYKENDVQTAPVKVALSDVPSTPTYRAQQFSAFAEILKSMPPNMQALLIPFALEMSDFGKRKEMAAFLREQLGIQADPNSPRRSRRNSRPARPPRRRPRLQCRTRNQRSRNDRPARRSCWPRPSASAPRQARRDADTVGLVDGAMARYEEELQKLRQQVTDRTTEWQTRLQQTEMHEQAETVRARIRAEAQRRRPAAGQVRTADRRSRPGAGPPGLPPTGRRVAHNRIPALGHGQPQQPQAPIEKSLGAFFHNPRTYPRTRSRKT